MLLETCLQMVRGEQLAVNFSNDNDMCAPTPWQCPVSKARLWTCPSLSGMGHIGMANDMGHVSMAGSCHGIGPGTLNIKVQGGKRRWRSDCWEKEPCTNGRMAAGTVKEEGSTGTGRETGRWKQDGWNLVLNGAVRLSLSHSYTCTCVSRCASLSCLASPNTPATWGVHLGPRIHFADPVALSCSYGLVWLWWKTTGGLIERTQVGFIGYPIRGTTSIPRCLP